MRPGCSTASSRVSHSSALSVANTLVAPARTEGTPATARASRTRPACALVRTSTATSPGPSDGSSRPSSQRESAATSSATSAARSAAIRSRTGPTIGSPVFQCARRPARGQHPQAERRRPGRADEPARRVGGLDPRHDDLLVAQRGAAEDGVQGADQRLVAAPVLRQPLARARGLDGLQVADDVGAAEGVDRLLGVADEGQRRGPLRGLLVERRPQDVPLDGVGVLELVDQHHREPRPQPRAGGGAELRMAQRAVQAQQHVVEREQPAPALAPLDLGAHGLGEPRPRARRVGGVAPGLDARAGVVDHGLADGERRGAVEVGGLRAGDGVLAQVEVVDDLGDHVVDALDERAVGIGVADDPEAGEHVLAELVGGRDRGGVEAGERGAQPGAPERHDGVVALGEQPDHGVVVAARARRVGQRALGGHEPAAHPLAQLARGLAPERHEHDLRQRRVALGDVAGRERGDRVRLAGARAGLEHRGAAREVAADVERGA